MSKLAGRSRSLPPPPPPPHVFRRPEPDAVAFHIQPDVQDGRVSFLSVHDHAYEVMPGEESTTSEDTFHASYSSPESNSTTSDDSFLHIACPSTDSSFPEDYFHPVASADEAPSKPEMTGEGESATELIGYNTTSAATSAWDDPPYENVGNTP
ncbi:uncharacterized protein [Littorina saxatilis]|uniref:uncharacterized protein n=1 Tax=Littorina saxatilis TaxID=31220 RepID=UPI0038B44AC3